MTNDVEEVRQELERLRRQNEQLGEIAIELLGALDALIRRGDAQGSVGPKDRVWYRAKVAVARAMGKPINLTTDDGK